MVIGQIRPLKKMALPRQSLGRGCHTSILPEGQQFLKFKYVSPQTLKKAIHYFLHFSLVVIRLVSFVVQTYDALPSFHSLS